MRTLGHVVSRPPIDELYGPQSEIFQIEDPNAGNKDYGTRRDAFFSNVFLALSIMSG